MIKNLYILVLLVVVGCTKQKNELPQRQQENPLSQYLSNSYHIYREVTATSDTYYFNNDMLLQFLSQYGQSSSNVFDYNGDGFVNTPDLLATTAGFGNVYQNQPDLFGATIIFQASSGWQINLQGWSICFLKVTPWDEEPPGAFIPDQLRSFFLDGVTLDGDFVKVYYYVD